MPTIDAIIDSSAIAKEVDGIAHRVKGTTAAVVTMQGEVIREEKAAADTICNHVNRGFHTLIQSQISQKMAHLQSRVDAKLMEMSSQKQSLISIRKKMEGDYHMITKRYSKLFEGLNTNLSNRIYELDNSLFALADKDQKLLLSRTKTLPSAVSIGQTESLALSQNIMTSNVKSKAATIVENIKRYIHGYTDQEALTKEVLIDDDMDSAVDSRLIYAPVVVMSLIDEEELSWNQANVSDELLIDSLTIEDYVEERMDTLPWQKDADKMQKVDVAFRQYLSTKANEDDRIIEMAKRLFDQNEHLTL